MSSVYELPELYEAVLQPEPYLERAVTTLVDRYLGGNVGLLLDPACGTGFWLRAIRARVSGGVDLCHEMVSWARQYSPRATVVLGDMRSLPDILKAPLDLIVNLETTIGHLGTQSDVLGHLVTAWRLTRPGGHYFLGLPLEVGGEPLLQGVGPWHSGRRVLRHGGEATATLTGLSPAFGVRQLHYRIDVKGRYDLPPSLEGCLTFARFTPTDWLRIINAAGWTLVAAHYVSLPGCPASTHLYPWGEVVAVLTRPV